MYFTLISVLGARNNSIGEDEETKMNGHVPVEGVGR